MFHDHGKKKTTYLSGTHYLHHCISFRLLDETLCCPRQNERSLSAWALAATHQQDDIRRYRQPAVIVHEHGLFPDAQVGSGPTHLSILLDLRFVDRAVGVSVRLREMTRHVTESRGPFRVTVRPMKPLLLGPMCFH